MIPNLFKFMMADPDKFISQLATEKPAAILKALLNKGVPTEHRAALLHQLAKSNPAAFAEVGAGLIEAAGNDADKEAKELAKKLKATLDELQTGPLRFGRVLSPPASGVAGRVHVMLHDGSTAWCVVPDDDLAKKLRRGDGVLLDGQGRAALFCDPTPPATGEEAKFERVLSDAQVLVTLRHDERRIMFASQSLIDLIDNEKVKPGDALIVNATQSFAFAALPASNELSHYKFMDQASVPVSTAMGNPPAYVTSFLRHARAILHEPQRLKRWNKPLARFALLEGLTGTGKSLSISLLWRLLAELVAEAAGVPVQQTPLKVFRLKASEVYDMYLGQSERNLARCFKEIEQFCRQKMTLADGTILPFTPCIVVIEELDGLARSRTNTEAIYGRILTTLLQLLDQSRPELSQIPAFFVATTNVIQQLDSAAVRRAGGVLVRFGTLNRRGFVSVLDKHLATLPLAERDGITDQNELRRRMVAQVADWAYCDNGPDAALATLVLGSGGTQPVNRRHFLTGALVQRSVQQATDRVLETELDRSEDHPLTIDRLFESFEEQMRSLADMLSRENVASILELGSGVHVADVRHHPRPAITPMELRIAS